MDCVHHWKIETPNGAGPAGAAGSWPAVQYSTCRKGLSPSRSIRSSAGVAPYYGSTWGAPQIGLQSDSFLARSSGRVRSEVPAG